MEWLKGNSSAERERNWLLAAAAMMNGPRLWAPISHSWNLSGITTEPSVPRLSGRERPACKIWPKLDRGKDWTDVTTIPHARLSSSVLRVNCCALLAFLYTLYCHGSNKHDTKTALHTPKMELRALNKPFKKSVSLLARHKTRTCHTSCRWSGHQEHVS